MSFAIEFRKRKPGVRSRLSCPCPCLTARGEVGCRQVRVYGLFRYREKSEPVVVGETANRFLVTALGRYILYHNKGWCDIDLTHELWFFLMCLAAVTSSHRGVNLLHSVCVCCVV